MVDLAGDAARQHGPLVSLRDIEQAQERIRPFIHRTPVFTSKAVDEIASRTISDRLAGQNDQAKGDDQGEAARDNGWSPRIRVRLAFKGEHLQRIGAFKMRGATNAILVTLDKLRNGNSPFDARHMHVVTHSSGNHAAAVACAANLVGAHAHIVMPKNAPNVKKSAVKSYGARIIECEPTQKAREDTANNLIIELQSQSIDNAVQFIHPYDEELVIAGQGTLALEMLEQVENDLQRHPGLSESPDRPWTQRNKDHEPALDVFVAPVGGGGMLSGVSAAARAKDPRIVIVAAEPENANDAAQSFTSGNLHPAITPPKTICDGLLTALSPFTFAHVQKNVSSVLTAKEADITSALQLTYERMKQLIEPSAAVPLAVILHNPEFALLIDRIARNKAEISASHASGSDDASVVEVRIGVVWSGGNVELARVAELMC